MEKIIHWLFTSGIDFVLYLVLGISIILGVKWFIEDSVRMKINEMQHRYRLRKSRANKKMTERQYNNPVLKHIFFLIKTTSKEKKEHDVIAFVTVTGILTVFGLMFSIFTTGDIVLSVFLAVLIGSLPYMLLRIRLQSIRYTTGTEMLNIIQILAQNYNACQYDIYYALIETQKDINNKTLKGVFRKLISELQSARNENEIRLAIDLLIYTSGSKWSKRLGNIILKAYLYDENVINTLLTLIRQMEETEEMLEEEKSHTLDKVYNGYLTAPMFIFSIVLGYIASGAQDYFVLQFVEYWPRLIFIVCTVMVTFSMIISFIMRKPKNDI